MRPLTNREKRDQRWTKWLKRVRHAGHLSAAQYVYLKEITLRSIDLSKSRPVRWLGRLAIETEVAPHYREIMYLTDDPFAARTR